ncbi:MAG: TetR/AcrR family transcriptional regulator [Candidatus Limnocylindrales bacterium]
MPDVKDPVTISLREERAAVTRGRITNAARQLFRSQGYGATTLTAVAWEAGVAVQTIYAVYRSKPGILRALRESVLNQPEAEALFEEALRARHGDRALELFARSIRRRWEYGADIVVIHRDAATADRAVRAEVARILAIRRAGLARLARSLDGELCADVDVEHATAILDALTLPEVYLELVDVQGWTADGFEVWLRRSLKQQLIA